MIDSFLNRFMSQKWEDLVMAHYPANSELIQASLPDDLFVDTFNENAWFSVVAFKLTDLSIRPFTFVKWNDFWEINLRTYVRDKMGNRGVWFYSLDSSDLVGVVGARLLYGLRYNFARIGRGGCPVDGKLVYQGNRGKMAHSIIEANWNNAPKLDVMPGSLDHFLLERYRFWARRRLAATCSCAFVKHVPYHAVRVKSIRYNGKLFASQGFAEPEIGPSLGHYCEGFSVEATAPEWVFSISGHANQR